MHNEDPGLITCSLTLSQPFMIFVTCSSRLLMFMGSLYCKQYGPDRWSDQGSVFASIKKLSEVHQSICSRQKKNSHFHDKNSFVCLFDVILYIPLTIFQLNRDGSYLVEPVLS